MQGFEIIKKSRHRVLFFLLVFFGLTACSNYVVTYDTNPAGAQIVCNGIQQGYSPLNLEYDKKGLKKHDFKIQPCVAVWMSGAKAEFASDISELVKQFPKGVMQTLQRPEHPGLDQDMQFAFQVLQMKQQEAYQAQQLMQQQMQQLNQRLHNTNQQIQQQNYNNQMLFQMQQLNNTMRYGF